MECVIYIVSYIVQLETNTNDEIISSTFLPIVVSQNNFKPQIPFSSGEA